MWTKLKGNLQMALVGVALMGWVCDAGADPITKPMLVDGTQVATMTFNETDDKRGFSLNVKGTAVVVSGTSTALKFGNFWSINNVSATLVSGPPFEGPLFGAESLHVDPPNDAVSHETAADIKFNIGVPTQFTRPAPHKPHFDQYSVVSSLSRGTMGDITSWTADFKGTHVPEPSTLLLLGSGLAGLATWRWKKAKVNQN